LHACACILVFGKEFMGIERSTFIVKDGKIVKVWRGVKATGHAEVVIAAINVLAESVV
jgi:thioredoxin-dependent peroxiredoxin